MSALLPDLHDRGMDRDVTVVMWGEFGQSHTHQQRRGSRSLAKALRWASSLAVACGSARQSATSTKYAEEAKDRPVHFQEVFATLYHNLGIDVRMLNSSILRAAHSTSSAIRSRYGN